MLVVLLTHESNARYRRLAHAMAQGIHRAGDKVVIRPVYLDPIKADVAICYGWKFHQRYKRYRNYIYADLGYWNREQYWRFSINGWSPRVPRSLGAERFERLGIPVRPWRDGGDEIIVAGSTAKACRDHGLGYMEWEKRAVRKLQALGKRVVYRPKPNDRMAKPIEGAEFDQRPISEALDSAWGWVTHHSNSALDALVAGIPVHCETGAASAFSCPIESMGSPKLLPGREAFLSDVAWLQWTLQEMESGEAWRFLRTHLT